MDVFAKRVSHWPTALIPAIRLVWSHTLFAGLSSTPERSRVSGWLLLVLLPGLLLYPCLKFRLLEPDEGRYAEIPREMLACGEWIVPQLQGQPYLDKPPLLYWLVMLSYSVFGVHDWSARLVPALAVHATILSCYGFGCRLFGQCRALRGALLLSIMPGLLSIGRLLNLDGLLTLWVTLGLFTGFLCLAPGASNRSRAAFTLACGLGVLTKGPIALVLILGPILAWRWFNSETTKSLSRRTWAAFAIGVLAINLPWYIAVSIRQPGFARYFFWQHNLERFFNPFDHQEPFWYYGPILLGGLMPATLWLVPILRGLLSGEAEFVRRRSPELGFCLLSGAGCVLFFSLSGSKLPTYILPAFPPSALAIGVLMERGQKLFTRRQWVVGAVWTIVMFVAHYAVLPWYADERSPMHEAEVVNQLCADPSVTVVSFPRNCDSVGFYLNRDDIRSTRSKHVNSLIEDLQTRSRTVVLFTHRSSFEALTYALPKELKLSRAADMRKTDLPPIFARLVGEVPWGLCDIGIVERVRANR